MRRQTLPIAVAALLLAPPSLSFAAETPPTPPPPAATMALVRVDAGPGATLESASFGRDYLWDRVCAAPCEIKVPVDRLYRLNGPGVVATRPVILFVEPDARVRLGFERKAAVPALAGGILLTVAAPVASVAGLAVWLGAPVWSEEAATARVALPRMTGIPLVTRAF